MAKKKKLKIQLSVVKFFIIGLLVIGIGFAVISGAGHLFKKSDYFKVRSIVIDPSLQFINRGDLRNVMGENIFTVDLKTAQRRLSYKYPQVSQLKVIKRFPSQIAVVAKQRLPFAQILVRNNLVILDEEGVVISSGEKEDKNLLRIVGPVSSRSRLVRGLPFRETSVQAALEIARLFQDNDSLSLYSIKEINAQNLSKIYFILSNKLKIIMDRDRVAQKIRILGVVLSQGKLDLKHVKYVDLRFKEPIIGKK